jgi:methionyl aminopeptidase
MITIKNKRSIAKMTKAGSALSTIIDTIGTQIKPGVTTLELDILIEEQLKQKGLVSKCKGYRGYKHVSCISVNDEVVHGVPSKTKVLKEGDLVKVDVCASFEGYCADMARCFFVGNVDDMAKKLTRVAKTALDKGISKAIPGNRVSDISFAIQQEVEQHGFSVVRDFAGHGIGKLMHEEPEIVNYGEPGQGATLRAGMTFAIEPMITMGKFDVYVTEDGWTVKTVDKSLAAHMEDTVLITDNGPKILTRQ